MLTAGTAQGNLPSQQNQEFQCQCKIIHDVVGIMQLAGKANLACTFFPPLSHSLLSPITSHSKELLSLPGFSLGRSSNLSLKQHLDLKLQKEPSCYCHHNYFPPHILSWAKIYLFPRTLWQL